MNDAIIISDIHLGSKVCQSKKIIEFLNLIESEQILTKSLIINGDLFDSWDFRKLKKNHWKVLSKIRSLSKKIHLVWINGNHDGPAEAISHLIGVDFKEQYIIRSGDKNIMILHGDKFDKFISKYPTIASMADFIYKIIQKIDPSFYLARLAKKSSKTFLRCSELIKEKAKTYAKAYKCQIVCCGHSHLELVCKNDGIEYYNSGCWTESPCHFITIKNGEVSLNKY